MITTRIPRTRWHRLGTAASPLNWHPGPAISQNAGDLGSVICLVITAQGVTDRFVNGSHRMDRDPGGLWQARSALLVIA
jgi:hypothetical protein